MNLLSWRGLAFTYLDEEASLAQQQAVGMMQHVWTNYEMRAFGRDKLQPLSGHGDDSWGGVGQTLVDALDTLWLMGFDEEFDRAAKWVESSLNFDKDLNVNLFETSIRHLGGLISAYALSGRAVFLEKARDLGERLWYAFPVLRGPEAAEQAGKKQVMEAKEKIPLLKKMMLQAGITAEVMDSFLGKAQAAEQLAEKLVPSTASSSPTAAHALPNSDINLRTHESQNLAGSVSLAEVYVPMEWKALAMLTGNCSYARAQDEAILLKPDGRAFPAPDNRISVGGRGDSFYEYLLKDALFSGDKADPLTKTLWQSFLAKLPQLLVEVHPKKAEAAVAAAMAAKGHRHKREKRKQRHSRPHISSQEQGAKKASAQPRWRGKSAPPGQQRGDGGASGGWFETWRDVKEPWMFLKEVGFTQTIPKIDHLVCFLPGALALDVLHHGGTKGARAVQRSLLTKDQKSELVLAHKLVQTCVQMYFRTVSDLAPEITRFTAHGLVDDTGSMHNILRPETIESLFVLWRTTKYPIYRNWGQRLLSAFYRTKTKFGFASLNNVNDPANKKDDMPSFFFAETLKYLFLLFSDDEFLPLESFVLSTEAHPVPTLKYLEAQGLKWPCPSPWLEESVEPAEVSRATADAGAAQADVATADAGAASGRESPVDAGAATGRETSREATSDPTRSHHAETGAGASAVTSIAADASVKVRDPSALAESLQNDAVVSDSKPSLGGDSSCWISGFNFENCCEPPPFGNPLCWDHDYTFDRCCGRKTRNANAPLLHSKGCHIVLVPVARMPDYL
ncbi:unnamed protein product [Polarella glacialis]|uniref:alpha-1,2-Mannosidase n=1 Tax=Polarella glacialis TaxID=89957 RepID=A0A813JJ53_POLGL|nr:unnamed protein product [Polarella glacialis]